MCKVHVSSLSSPLPFISSSPTMSAAAKVFRENANALITGAASGVGLAVSKLCASHGMNVILVDRDASKLSEAKSAISSKGSVDVHTMDVASLSDWGLLKDKVEQGGKKLDFLHLNAGIGLKGEWTDSKYFREIFDVNMYGGMYLPHATLNATCVDTRD